MLIKIDDKKIKKALRSLSQLVGICNHGKTPIAADAHNLKIFEEIQEILEDLLEVRKEDDSHPQI